MVALERCLSYERDAVDAALVRAITAVGGMGAFVKPGMRVLIKVNMLSGYAPERAVTTHPEMVRAVAKQVLAAGATPIIGDSPGGPTRPSFVKRAYQLTGYAEVAREMGIECSLDLESHHVKQFDITGMVINADAVISLAKLKTHGLTTMTCAVKNMFGAVPGLKKMEYHGRYPVTSDFCGMLVDLCEAVRPSLSIVDGVVAMQGHGPAGGSPRAMNAIVVGSNPHEVDAVCAQLIGLNENTLFTLKHALSRGLYSKDNIEIIGESVESLSVTDFDIPMARATTSMSAGMPRFLRGVANWATRVKPVFPDNCPCCGTCAESCPAHAIIYVSGAPQLNKKACISCFCCQELCPKQIIRTGRSVVSRVIGERG